MGFSNTDIGSVVQACPLAAKPKPKYWIEIVLVDEENAPVPRAKYFVNLPNSDVVQGFLDGNGKARIDNIPVPGNCQVTFPDLDMDAWVKV